MPGYTLTGRFSNATLADSAVGRLEVLGVPQTHIITSSTAEGIVVRAVVDGRLVEKARDILRFG